MSSADRHARRAPAARSSWPAARSIRRNCCSCRASVRATCCARPASRCCMTRPAVGRNLQDHLCFDHVYRSKVPSLNDDALSLVGQAARRAALHPDAPGAAVAQRQPGRRLLPRAAGVRSGPTSSSISRRSRYEKAMPGIRARDQDRSRFPGFIISVSPCRPTSRGHLQIRSADPRAAPAIHPNYLSTNHDVEELLAGARFLRRLAATPSHGGDHRGGAEARPAGRERRRAASPTSARAAIRCSIRSAPAAWDPIPPTIGGRSSPEGAWARSACASSMRRSSRP